jgi:hypothetical protein
MKRWLPFIAVLLVADNAAAIPFLEDLSIATVIKQNIEQAVRAKKTLQMVRDLSAEMSDVAFFARDAVQTANNVRLIIEDPAKFARYTLEGWADTYPEVHQILAHTIDARMALSDLSDPEFYRVYDPYAYVRTFDSLQNVSHGAYDIAARAVDLWGVHDSHDKTMTQIHKEHEAATDAFRDFATALNFLGISPTRAQVHTARHTAISMMASVQAAAALERIGARSEVQFMEEHAASENARVRRQQMQADFARVRLDWNLNPVGGGMRPVEGNSK